MDSILVLLINVAFTIVTFYILSYHFKSRLSDMKESLEMHDRYIKNEVKYLQDKVSTLRNYHITHVEEFNLLLNNLNLEVSYTPAKLILRDKT
jgi:hypothetical protein